MTMDRRALLKAGGLTALASCRAARGPNAVLAAPRLPSRNTRSASALGSSSSRPTDHVHSETVRPALLPHTPHRRGRSARKSVRRAGWTGLHGAGAQSRCVRSRRVLTLKEFEPAFSRGGDMAMDFLAPADTDPELRDQGESAMKASLGKDALHGTKWAIGPSRSPAACSATVSPFA
jgi:hypothetical protein